MVVLGFVSAPLLGLWTLLTLLKFQAAQQAASGERLRAAFAGFTELLLGSAWIRLYANLTTTAEAKVKLAKRADKLQDRFQRAAGPDPIHPPFWQRRRRHLRGCIDLAVDRVRGRALRVPLSSLRRHVTIVGVTGWGKTVAIARIIHGVLSQPKPWAVIVVDCKGGELRDTAEELARSFGVPLQEVNPGRAGSLRYDITKLGDAPEIADKLTPAFPATPDSSVYRDTSYAPLVHTTAAHLSVNGKVQLEELEATLDQAALNQLAGEVRELSPRTHAALTRISRRMQNPRHTTSSALSGMASRLDALRAGRFGAVLDGDGPVLDLEKAASETGVTYISLPALASSADLRMMGRVLLQDLKLLALLRLDKSRQGRPCLVVLDEFSALDDPENVKDFLRQAREPWLPCVTASQSLPEPGGCRNELLQAGVVLFLKCLADDADVFAKLAGTEISAAMDREIEFFPARSRKAAIGDTESFTCHPRWFRRFNQPRLLRHPLRPPGRGADGHHRPDLTAAARRPSWGSR